MKRTMLATAVAIALVIPMSTASSAQDSPESLGDVVADARAMTDAPELDADVEPESLLAPDGTLRVRSGPLAVGITLPEVPTDPDEGLPALGDEIVLAGGGRSVSANLVIMDAGVSTYDFRFTLPAGARLIPESDGSVSIGRRTEAGDVIFGTIAAPWAVDASGQPVPTHYTLRGTILTQVVDATNAVLPVVADPWVDLGWSIYIKYGKNDVKRYTEATNLTNKAIALAACAKVPWPYNAYCGLASTTALDGIGKTFVDARKANKCVEIGLAYITYIPVSWKSYSC